VPLPDLIDRHLRRCVGLAGEVALEVTAIGPVPPFDAEMRVLHERAVVH
jgi:hypothetical protein